VLEQIFTHKSETSTKLSHNDDMTYSLHSGTNKLSENLLSVKDNTHLNTTVQNTYPFHRQMLEQLLSGVARLIKASAYWPPLAFRLYEIIYIHKTEYLLYV